MTETGAYLIALACVHASAMTMSKHTLVDPKCAEANLRILRYVFRANVAVMLTTFIVLIKYQPSSLKPFLWSCGAALFCYGTIDNLGNPGFLTESDGTVRLIRSGKDLRISKTPALGPFYLTIYLSWLVEAVLATTGFSVICWVFVLPAVYLFVRIYKFYSAKAALANMPSHKPYAQRLSEAHAARAKAIIR